MRKKPPAYYVYTSTVHMVTYMQLLMLRTRHVRPSSHAIDTVVPLDHRRASVLVIRGGERGGVQRTVAAAVQSVRVFVTHATAAVTDNTAAGVTAVAGVLVVELAVVLAAAVAAVLVRFVLLLQRRRVQVHAHVHQQRACRSATRHQ